MCNPVAWYVGSALVTAYVGHEQSVEQAEYQNDLHEANMKAAENAHEVEAQQVQERMNQEREIAARDIEMVEREGRRAQATALASSEAQGLSVEMLMGDYEREVARERETVERQLDFNLSQHRSSLDGLRVQRESRINSVPGMEGPDAGDFATNATLNFATSYGNYYANTYGGNPSET